MSRPPVSICIPAWNGWEATRACLDSLRPTLGVRDQVIVVDNASSDGTAAGLRMYPWVEVVSNGQNRGFAGGANDAIARARHDLVIFLHNDTVAAPRWVEALVRCFEDPQVVAAGPRSNAYAGRQGVPEAEYNDGAGMRRFARGWCTANRGMVDTVDMLSGFCLAVRRSSLLDLGGFDEGYGEGSFEVEDLCLKLRDAGGRLVVCHDSYVHHQGRLSYDRNGIDWLEQRKRYSRRFQEQHPGESTAGGAVTVSACLITKDEQDRIEGCVASLAEMADEVVIYDTGSGDRTVEIARSMGARVREGYWDDNFARARNEALRDCSGEWILWIDADETFHTLDAQALKSELARTRPEVDGYSVMIRNAVGAGAGSELTHHATRLFRRAHCEWAGRLHEQVSRRGDHGSITQGLLGEHVWIHHTGYLDDVMVSRNKAERNLRVAQAEVDQADGWDQGYSLTSLGRSLVMTGRVPEALEKVTEALDHTDNGITRRLAIRTAIECTVILGRLDESLSWCARLRQEGVHPNTAASLEAGVRLARQEWEKALGLLDGVSSSTADGDGFAIAPGTLAAQRAQALAAVGRADDAADELLRALDEEGVLDTHLGSLVEHLIRAGRPLDILVRAIPAERSVLFMAQVLQLEAEKADLVLESCIAAGLLSQPVLATASKLAVRLPVERALVWSSRLRLAGHATACPLIGIAGSNDDRVVRARAAAVAHRMFGDSRAEPLFRETIEAASRVECDQISSEIAQLSPDLLQTISRLESKAV